MATGIQEHVEIFSSQKDKSMNLNMGTIPVETLEGKRRKQIMRARDLYQ